MPRKARTTKTVQKVQIVPHKKTASQKVSKQAFKNRLLTKLGYSDIFTMVTGLAGVTTEYIFNMNGIYDPDATFAGHQPYGRDTYALIYNKYKVHSIKYRVEAIGSLNSAPAVLNVVPNQLVSPIGGLSIQLESPYAKSAITSYGERVLLKGSVDLARMTGRTKTQYGSDSLYEAIMTSNPSEQMGLHVSLGQPSTQTSCVLKVWIEYLVEFFDPIQQAQS